MKRLFVGLTLLLMSFLSALDSLAWLRDLAARIGLYRWVIELVLALAVVTLFARKAELHRRLLFPRRGDQLLIAGIGVYALAVAAATGALVQAMGFVAKLADSGLGGVPTLVANVYPQPVFIAAQLLLMLGAFRALANLVPPGEFAEDY